LAKIVLTQKDDSGYKDVPGKLYHFPSMYLRAANSAIGDACLFYAPKKGGHGVHRMAYWATAIIRGIRPDPHLENHFYADLEHFLEFTDPVPLHADGEGFWESRLDNEGLLNKGSIRRSVRPIEESEFGKICAAGFRTGLYDPSLGDPFGPFPAVEEEQAQFERPTIPTLVNRKFRDRVFAKHVRDAYDSRCAFTGLRIINGGGRAEMEAAHIRPVEHNGPDFVRNGLALSRTVHWLFDRGLISIDDNFRFLTVRKLLPDGVDRLLNANGEVSVPDRERDRPSPTFLRWHRENCFKG
jgi:putative restriction endonuclease